MTLSSRSKQADLRKQSAPPRDFMPELTVPNDVSVHAAFAAWLQLRREAALTQLEVLQKEKKADVYRLTFASGASVIAKRCVAETARLEFLIYQNILPRLPLPGLECFGLVDDADSRFLWIFMEDAGPGDYEIHKDGGELAARWLAVVHSQACRQPDLAEALPVRALPYYLEQLHAACKRIEENLHNRHLTPEDSDVLRNLVGKLRLVASRWSHLQGLCLEMPYTLIHGDFVPKNLRVRSYEAHEAVLPLDWEMAGWGNVPIDLALFWEMSGSPSVRSYASVVREHTPALTMDMLHDLAKTGVTLRLICSVAWAAKGLAYEWVARPMRQMRSYVADFEKLFQSP